MDCSPPGSSVHGVSQAGILEWVAISFSRVSFQPRDQTCVSCIGRWEAQIAKEIHFFISLNYRIMWSYLSLLRPIHCSSSGQAVWYLPAIYKQLLFFWRIFFFILIWKTTYFSKPRANCSSVRPSSFRLLSQLIFILLYSHFILQWYHFPKSQLPSSEASPTPSKKQCDLAERTTLWRWLEPKS